ncbi:hypothetical protein [Bacteroides sp.]|uniref:hypothetical protein n=1 Tax=Bacteroides sp. TaxID=29523 RepID=UPI00260D88F7|nr:hypothetical protein [Bacteroides sp.]MDD3038888.1 hypothetical protein [Bacteroides sp.]
MNKKRDLYCLNCSLCSNLLSKLEKLEIKCDRITEELSEVKNLIASFPPEVGILIDSIEHSAKDLYDQSVAHRRYVEQCINGKPCMHLTRRIGDGL